MARRIEQILGKKPYIVSARFSRLYADANRDASSAYESDPGRAVYEVYHLHLREYVDAVRAQYPRGAILIDIHGQSAQSDTIFRGTRDLETVQNLLSRHGVDGLTGPSSILGSLERRGFHVVPGSQEQGLAEDARFKGGFIVSHYGSGQADGIDAIQLETGWSVRRSPEFSEALAQAICEYYRKYLAAPGDS